MPSYKNIEGPTRGRARAFVLGSIAFALFVVFLAGDGEMVRASGEPLEIETFFHLAAADDAVSGLAESVIFENWHPSSTAMVLEVTRFSGRVSHLLGRLEQVTGERFHGDLDRAWKYLWRQDYAPHKDYARFKARLYRELDPRFAAYFQPANASDAGSTQPESPSALPATIRLDEIRWGGVQRDGIPPLKNPKMIAASEASYLGNDDIVFGLEVNGDARAYPKRILAWHEMFKDTVGGVSVNGVYCTLCGSMILYDTHHAGQHYELGTSGFLYRSNKLMYDHATESLWSTLDGRPVVGQLVGQGIALNSRAVVTTTWQAWREQHPETTVLSLETGHVRDYSEGAAYRDYFATDQVMFTVPKLDRRLANKAEVLILRFREGGTPPTAVEVDALKPKSFHAGRLGRVNYVILTDRSGASRVYENPSPGVKSYDGANRVEDASGKEWVVSEASLVGAAGHERLRLPAHRAFWFGWYAAYPDTELIRFE